jgi:hypothetical protein
MRCLSRVVFYLILGRLAFDFSRLVGLGKQGRRVQERKYCGSVFQQDESVGTKPARNEWRRMEAQEKGLVVLHNL